MVFELYVKTSFLYVLWYFNHTNIWGNILFPNNSTNVWMEILSFHFPINKREL